MKVGETRVVRESEDVFVVHFGPNPTPDEMREIVGFTAKRAEGKGVFVMLDFTDLKTLSTETRKVIGETTKGVNFRAIGMFGASFHIRVLAKLINGAIGLFQKRAFPEEFFDTREATLAWFDELRRRHGVGAA